ncbi:D-tyrosyl-tRNA(Tyr) deacylase [Riemerella anatipestifer]|uniref:D-aminoacyl-tRNA deacylase n=1 Tax=Riemerella anatipestifer (strain ATCC 11845 / DSM 15868 / JCM 9532 / NCTC 11014) TaxID=693978 RepID=E4T9R6_RIEAD|nr:D-aminoacyl-tRNA deacylase [Riemerella anatipestifer]ADQ81747.1 D-tyrosyl-tRNA(Tyr) deacylase [Riemerella anatipestifer ATCC 11845 = DSM 15868]ADZ12758.1 D-Tyr-tRNAtyr deacylase [Riemerella anatipestifer RA-GD]AFD55757.1 D-tyrosyl-tRNA(tyr) deacylase [Riemerella anatipestifer ATCC 11845 = DSM 15868]AGC40344.1 D-Tyr-tRNAtyr deacylase [Riemerella anatipestifer RA-CH-2]AKP68993.1 D-tyrosyl-tRNA(tyr) deacylase [Riemerella anatipestifer]
MKVVVQRVSSASVVVEGVEVSKISKGYLLLVGVEETDEKADADWLVKKIVNLRIFSDDEGKMNLSIKEVDGEVLCVSQFTLMADYKKGNRPSFITAARPDLAVPMFEYFKSEMAEYGVPVSSGIFGADMKVSLTNDGPVTIIMNSKIR